MEKKRERTIGVRVNPEEEQRLGELAQATGTTVSDVLRALVAQATVVEVARPVVRLRPEGHEQAQEGSR